eukprot:Sspe_Gene.44533::Locus_21844_Transcript_1_1_Confidence_1.000_Length_1051::g.44533::m.44533
MNISEDAARLRFDAFFHTFCPSRIGEVEDIVRARREDDGYIDALTTLCEEYQAHGARLDQWEGDLPQAVVLYVLSRFFEVADPAGMGRVPALAASISTGDTTLSTVLHSLCLKYRVAPDAWAGEYPKALRDSRDTRPPPRRTSQLSSPTEDSDRSLSARPWSDTQQMLETAFAYTPGEESQESDRESTPPIKYSSVKLKERDAEDMGGRCAPVEPMEVPALPSPPTTFSRRRAATSVANGASKEWEERITHFYAQHNPAKIPEVHGLLEMYRGKEEALYHAIVAKYLPPRPGTSDDQPPPLQYTRNHHHQHHHQQSQQHRHHQQQQHHQH